MTISADAIENFRKEFEAEPNFDKRRQLMELCAQAKAVGELTSPEYISRLRGVMGEVAWMPIETAPFDVPIILWGQKYGRITVDEWRHYCKHNEPQYTHWQPLPASPVGEVKG